MPIYEYVCQECNRPFERIVLRQTEPISCPNCGSKRNTLQYSVVNTPNKSGNGGATSMSGSGGGCCGPSGCGCG